MYRPRPTLDAPDQQRQTERDGNVPTSRGGPSAGAFRIGACTSTTVLSVKTSGTVGWNEMGERGYPFKRPSFGGTGDIVLVFLIIGTMAGMLIGLRFSVFALIPATLLATVAIILTDQHGLEDHRTYCAWNRCVASDWVYRRLCCSILCSPVSRRSAGPVPDPEIAFELDGKFRKRFEGTDRARRSEALKPTG